MLLFSVVLLSQDDLAPKKAVRRAHDELKSSPWPFSIEPIVGKIPQKDQLICNVKFRPTELSKFSCKLHLRYILTYSRHCCCCNKTSFIVSIRK